MSELTHKPQRMSYAELGDLLRWLAEAVETGDSMEGFLEYLIPSDVAPGVDVRARFRTGNRMGQGGMTFIGELS